jgi:hypothetical protein
MFWIFSIIVFCFFFIVHSSSSSFARYNEQVVSAAIRCPQIHKKHVEALCRLANDEKLPDSLEPFTRKLPQGSGEDFDVLIKKAHDYITCKKGLLEQSVFAFDEHRNFKPIPDPDSIVVKVGWDMVDRFRVPEILRLGACIYYYSKKHLVVHVYDGLNLSSMGIYDTRPIMPYISRVKVMKVAKIDP